MSDDEKDDLLTGCGFTAQPTQNEPEEIAVNEKAREHCGLGNSDDPEILLALGGLPAPPPPANKDAENTKK